MPRSPVPHELGVFPCDMSVRIEYGPYRQPRLSEKLKRAVSQEDLGTRSRHESCVREVLDDLGFWKPMKNMSTAEAGRSTGSTEGATLVVSRCSKASEEPRSELPVMQSSSTTAFDHQRRRVLHGRDGREPAGNKGRVVVETTIGHAGRITVGPVAPQDWLRMGESIMKVMTAISRDGPIALGGCLDPERAEAVAQRLADRILRGAA